jgi:Holliday junction resolvase RusA-like endonuclease
VTVVYTLHIPRWQPRRLNELLSCHWAKAARLKRADRQMIAAYARKAKTPQATGKRRVMLTILLKPHQRGADPDAYHKSYLDSLVYAGLLIDDNRQHVELAPVQYRRAGEQDWGTIVALEDIESPGRD